MGEAPNRTALILATNNIPSIVQSQNVPPFRRRGNDEDADDSVIATH